MWGWAPPETSLTCNVGTIISLLCSRDRPVSPGALVNETVLTPLISAYGLYTGPGLKKELRSEEDSSPQVPPAAEAEMRKEGPRGSVQSLELNAS